jgi:DNA-binding NtrC family response regulator
VRVGSTLDEVSRRLIEATLAECGSKRKAADMLGISLKTLYNRLAVYKSESEGEDEEQDEARGERERRAA